MTETLAIYTIRIKNNPERAEKILEQIDEMFLWLENAVLEDVEFLKQQLEDLRESIQIRKDVEEEKEKKKK